MISAAQGRVQGRQPAAVIDIGSNSVRLVVYEGVNRSPTVLFNEKILCGLGKGLVKTGKLNAKAVQSALRALRRFRALADQAGAVSLDVLATAAAREAENGSQFIQGSRSVAQGADQGPVRAGKRPIIRRSALFRVFTIRTALPVILAAAVSNSSMSRAARSAMALRCRSAACACRTCRTAI